MTEPFDLAKLRRAFGPAAEAKEAKLPEQLSSVKARRDPFPEARAALSRAEALSRSQFPERRETLDHFFSEAWHLVMLMEQSSTPRADEPSEGGDRQDEAEAAEDPRGRMMELLDELTELLEVFAMVGR